MAEEQTFRQELHSDEPETARMGMWLFLFTELLLFGGLFLCYAVYYQMYPSDFHAAGQHLNRVLGTTNTVVLLTSSLLVALAVSNCQLDKIERARRMLLYSCALALVFLCIKAVEWGTDFHRGVYPGGSEYLLLPKGQMTFFNLYFLMTGLHGFHIILGASLLLWAWKRMGQGRITATRFVALENVGLYWHLVDIIWIYLFPLFYLVV